MLLLSLHQVADEEGLGTVQLAIRRLLSLTTDARDANAPVIAREWREAFAGPYFYFDAIDGDLDVLWERLHQKLPTNTAGAIYRPGRRADYQFLPSAWLGAQETKRINIRSHGSIGHVGLEQTRTIISDKEAVSRTQYVLDITSALAADLTALDDVLAAAGYHMKHPLRRRLAMFGKP